MRTQRRTPQRVTLAHLDISGTNGPGATVTATTVDGAIFEPKTTQVLGEGLSRNLAAGVWLIPGLHAVSGDDTITDEAGHVWIVSEASTAWHDRTEAAVRRATPLPTLVAIGTGTTAPRWDATKRRTVTDPAGAVYTGRARLTTRAGTPDARTEAAGDDLAIRTYDVELAPTTGAGSVEIGHRLVVQAPSGPSTGAVPGDDPALWGRTLTVTGVARGSGQLARFLTARLDT